MIIIVQINDTLISLEVQRSETSLTKPKFHFFANNFYIWLNYAMYIDRFERRYVLGCTCLRPERFLEANRCPKGQGKSQGRRGCTAQYIPFQGSVQPLSQKAQNGPNYSKRPKMTQRVPKCSNITQIAPNLPEMSQNCINFAKLPKWLKIILKA